LRVAPKWNTPLNASTRMATVSKWLLNIDNFKILPRDIINSEINSQKSFSQNAFSFLEISDILKMH
jgi:hypothetical protein